jgi:hypothetical protein
VTRFRLALGLALLVVPATANAGPPFLTDDPEPTDVKHWELYAPLFEAEGSGRDFEGSFGTEINYGAAPDVQLTLGLPTAVSHDASGWRWGSGDIEASVKYRFYHDEAAGVQIAAFPGMTLPTASHGLGAGKVTAFLPVWAQKDSGAWSVFGGGGYAVNAGSGNRDYWTGGIALTRQLTERILVGAEVDRQGPDTVGGRSSTKLGLGGIVDLKGPLRLLASGGPTFVDGGDSGFHAFVAVGLDF